MLDISRIIALFATALLLMLAGCDRTQERIAGKWKVVNDPGATTWEFSKNGTVKTGSISGRYTFGDRNRLKIQTPFATFVYEVEVKKDAMVWKDPNGSRTELTRVP